MTRDPAQRRDVLATNVTIIHLQAALLRRQLEQRPDLGEADRRWLDARLATIEQAARAITPLLADDEDVAPEQWLRGIPTRRLTTLQRRYHRN